MTGEAYGKAGDPTRHSSTLHLLGSHGVSFLTLPKFHTNVSHMNLSSSLHFLLLSLLLLVSAPGLWKRKMGRSAYPFDSERSLLNTPLS